VIDAIAHLLEDDTAGDPMGGLKWTRKTTEKVSLELGTAGLQVSPNTVGRLLQQLGYALRVNHKKRAARATHPERNRQFEYIAAMRRDFQRRHLPILSIDTKKKELVGQFKNPGAVWAKTATEVYDHDFRSDADGMAIPFGLYDITANRGHIVVGTSHETPAFAADAVALWWLQEGNCRYPGARELLLLADGGGANGPRKHAWKHALQNKIADRHGLTVTVCHYPPGASKWNPVEHRLFSEVSKNWAGKPLDSYETILKYIRTTKTKTGLKVRATLVTRNYDTGIVVPPEEVARLNVRPHRTLPAWNYTITSRCCRGP
jgi:hypothetical protein